MPPQYRTRHPRDPSWVATYGADERGSPWASLTYNGVLVRYDATEIDYHVERPVLSVLRFLSEFGFVGCTDDVADAMAWLSGKSIDETLSPSPQGRRRAPRRGVVAGAEGHRELAGGKRLRARRRTPTPYG